MGTLRGVQAAYTSVGDENVVLAWVDDEVGWGIFAAKDFAQGKRPRPHRRRDIDAATSVPGLAHIGAETRPHRPAQMRAQGWDRMGWDGMDWNDGVFGGRRVHLDDRRRRARAVDDQADAGAFSVTAARYP